MCLPISAFGFLRDLGAWTMVAVILGFLLSCEISHHFMVQGGILCWLQMGPMVLLSSLGANTNLRFFKPIFSLYGLLVGSFIRVLGWNSSLPFQAQMYLLFIQASQLNKAPEHDYPPGIPVEERNGTFCVHTCSS